MAKRNKPISPRQQRCLEEYEKYKDVAVNDGVEWTKKTTKDMLDTASQELDE